MGGLCFCYEQNAVKQEQTQFQARSPRGGALGPSTRLYCQTKNLTPSLLQNVLLQLTSDFRASSY